jgi:hypothetical protein
VADNTGGCGRRPLIIVCRYSHLFYVQVLCIHLPLEKLVEMAGNFGSRIGSMQLSKHVVFSWGILGFDRPFHLIRLSDRQQSSVSSFGTYSTPKVQNMVYIKRQMLTIGSAPCLTLPAAKPPRTCNPFTSCRKVTAAVPSYCSYTLQLPPRVR